MFDKETIYDERIAPLMKEVIQICKSEGIPLVAQFYLKQQHPDADEENGAMYCTTSIVPNDVEIYQEHRDHLNYVAEVMKYGKNGKPWFMAVTVTKEVSHE